MILRPFFSYFGGKWRIARYYPEPEHSTIVEPFAGSAGYALRYPDRDVLLADVDEHVVGTWQYLVRASSSEILSLPLLEPGMTVDDIEGIPQEARWLIGWWCNKASVAPRVRMSAWAREERYAGQFWGERVRSRIAAQVDSIRHWRIHHGPYHEISDGPATWFVDPPYTGAGRFYRHGSTGIDYAALAAWCRSRTGQVIVCEAEGAEWLPFEPFRDAPGTVGKGRTGRSAEVAWIR